MVKVIDWSEVPDIAKKENMVDIWIAFEDRGLSCHFTYGFNGEQYYSLGDRYWHPLYIKTYERFLEYIDEENLYYNGTVLVKVK